MIPPASKPRTPYRPASHTSGGEKIVLGPVFTVWVPVRDYWIMADGCRQDSMHAPLKHQAAEHTI